MPYIQQVQLTAAVNELYKRSSNLNS